jgi:hypothetical protein
MIKNEVVRETVTSLEIISSIIQPGDVAVIEPDLHFVICIGLINIRDPHFDLGTPNDIIFRRLGLGRARNKR